MRHVTTFLLNKRLNKWLILIFCILCVIIGRLVYVQFIQSGTLVDKAENLWLRDIVFEPERGKIYDRHDKVIVDNDIVTTVILIPAQIENKDAMANALTDILGMSKDQAESYVERRASSVIVHPEGRKITEAQEKQLREMKLSGLYLAKDSKRRYPYDTQLAHILGFTGIDNQGLMGLELQHDSWLQGKQGSFAYFSDAKGGSLSQAGGKYNEPVNGNHLRTTIDLRIQSIIERELSIAEKKYKPEGAIAIAVNPNNGEVLGMASRPTYHPSNYKKVQDDIYNRNLPIWSTFEPGSTFKIITLAAALEENKIDLEKDEYYDKGHISVGDAKLRCWKAGGHGSQTMLEVVQNSCNPGFVHLGQQIGKEKLFSYIESFGFGEKTGIDLNGESRGILFALNQVGPVELATTAFGQGVSVTPIQQVMALSAVINGGYLYEPYVSKDWIDGRTSKVSKSRNKSVKRRVISEETSDEMRHVLESVVAKGTGRPAYIDHYRVGGKTGTAQKVGENGTYLADEHIVSFIGFAPANDPEIVVYVAIDNPQETIQFGGVVAAPIVKDILEDSLIQLGVEPSNEGLDKEVIWPEVDKIQAPDLIGLNKQDVLKKLYPFDIEIVGEGDYIIDQSPKPNLLLEEDEIIRIYVTQNKSNK